MAKPKLLLAIERLSVDDISAAKKTLKQKLYQKRPDLFKLFELLSSSASEKPKEIIWKKIYGSKVAYNDLKWRTIMMQVNAELEIILKETFLSNHDPLLSELISIKAFYNKKLNKHFDSSWSTLNKIMESPRHSDHFYYMAKASEIKQNLIFQKGRKHLSFDDLRQSDYYNEIYYRCQKLKTGCYAIANQITQDADIGIEDAFIKDCIKEYGDQIPLINLYGSILFLFRNKENLTLGSCQDLFINAVENIHKEESLNILTLLMNYCIDSKINKGQLEYFHNLFHLYKLGIQEEILFDNEALNPMHYKNIITVGLNTQNYDWTKSFIEKYTKRIPSKDQDNAYNFNMAKVLFQQEAYSEVIQLLHTVEYDNIQYKLGTKLILVKTYYELNELQALEALIESFRVLLVRTTKISKDLKNRYIEFLRILKKLTYLNTYDKEEFLKLQEQINEKKQIVGKKWILEKLAMKNKKA